MCTLFLPAIYKYLKKYYFIIAHRYVMLKCTVCRSYRRCATNTNKFIFTSDRTKFFRTKCDSVLKVNNFTVLSNIWYKHIIYHLPTKWLNLLKGECEYRSCIYYL